MWPGFAASENKTGCACPSPTAPAARLSSGATTRLGSKNWICPRPSHFGAGAHRVIERKQARLQLGQAAAAHRAGKLGGKPVLLAAVHFQRSPGRRHGAARFRKDSASCCLASSRTFQPVNHHIDSVLFVLSSRHGVQFVNLAIHPHRNKALRAQFGQTNPAARPLPTTTGASTISLVSSAGKASTWSTIWLTVWFPAAVRGRANGVPTRANSRRR